MVCTFFFLKNFFFKIKIFIYYGFASWWENLATKVKLGRKNSYQAELNGYAVEKSKD